MNISFLYRQRGVSIIEVLVGVAILSLVVIFTYNSLVISINVARTAHDRAAALYYAEAGHEFVRFLRDDDWSTLSSLTVDTPYALDVATSSVSIGGGSDVLAGAYTRTVTLREVYRDGDDDIVSTGGSLDTESYYIDVEVAWGNGESIETRSLLTNMMTL